MLYAEQDEARRTQEMEISLMEDPRAYQIPPRVKGMHMPDCSFMDDTIQFAIHNCPGAFPEFLKKGECEMLVSYESGQIIVLPCTKGQTGVCDSSISSLRFDIETASPTQSNCHAKPQWVSTWPNAELINPDTRFHCRVAWFYTPDGSMVPGRWPCHFRGVPAGRPTRPFWANVQEVCVDGFPLTKGLMWRLRKFSIVLDLEVIEAARKRNNIKQSAYHHRLPWSLQEEWSLSPITPTQRFEPADVTGTVEDQTTLNTSSHNILQRFMEQASQAAENPVQQNEEVLITANQRQLARDSPGESALSPSRCKPRLSNSLFNDRPMPLATIKEEEPQGMQNVVTTSSSSGEAEGLGSSMHPGPLISEKFHRRYLTLRTKVLGDKSLRQVQSGRAGVEPLSRRVEVENLSPSFAQFEDRKFQKAVEHRTPASTEVVKQMYQPSIDTILAVEVRSGFRIVRMKYDLTQEKSSQDLPQNITQEALTGVTKMVDVGTIDGAKIVLNAPLMQEDSDHGDAQGDYECSHSLRGGLAPVEALPLDEIEQEERRHHFLPQLPPHSTSPPPIRPNIRITRGEVPMEIPNLLHLGPASVPRPEATPQGFTGVSRGEISQTASITSPFQTRTEPDFDEGDERLSPRVRVPILTNPSPESQPNFTPHRTAPRGPNQAPQNSIPETLVREPIASNRQFPLARPIHERVTRSENTANPHRISARPPLHLLTPSLTQANRAQVHTFSSVPLLGADVPQSPYGGFVSEFHFAVNHAQWLRSVSFSENVEALRRITLQAIHVLRQIQQMPIVLIPHWREDRAERYLTELRNQYRALATRLCQVFASRPQGITNEERQQVMGDNFWEGIDEELRPRSMVRMEALSRIVVDARSGGSRRNQSRPVQGEASGVLHGNDGGSVDGSVYGPDREDIEQLVRIGYVSHPGRGLDSGELTRAILAMTIGILMTKVRANRRTTVRLRCPMIWDTMGSKECGDSGKQDTCVTYEFVYPGLESNLSYMTDVQQDCDACWVGSTKWVPGTTMWSCCIVAGSCLCGVLIIYCFLSLGYT